MRAGTGETPDMQQRSGQLRRAAFTVHVALLPWRTPTRRAEFTLRYRRSGICYGATDPVYQAKDCHTERSIGGLRLQPPSTPRSGVVKLDHWRRCRPKPDGVAKYFIGHLKHLSLPSNSHKKSQH